MILEVLWAVIMLLTLITVFPNGPASQWPYAHGGLLWLAVLFLGLYIFMPALRG
jgi:hypothetical protein